MRWTAAAPALLLVATLGATPATGGETYYPPPEVEHPPGYWLAQDLERHQLERVAAAYRVDAQHHRGASGGKFKVGGLLMGTGLVLGIVGASQEGAAAMGVVGGLVIGAGGAMVSVGALQGQHAERMDDWADTLDRAVVGR